MSRTATAPQPPLFHQKSSTPSARHSSKGNLASQPPPPAPSCGGFQRHFSKKPAKGQAQANATSPLKQQVAPMSASDMLGIATNAEASPDPMAIAEPSSIVWTDEADNMSIATSVPSMSAGSSRSSESAPSLVTPETTPASSIYGDVGDMVNVSANPSLASIPSMATQSPRSWVNGFGKMARAAISPFSRRERREGDSPKVVSSSPVPGMSPSASSLLSPYVAPSPGMSPSSLVSPMAFTITPAPEALEMMDSPLPHHVLPPAIAHPANAPPALTPDSPIENPADALRRYEWAEQQREQVTEFARLCSQWPQSSYNVAKYGPNGCANAYIPQSWANPRFVVRTMQRQDQLERQLCDYEATFYSASSSSTRSLSTDDSNPSSYSFMSSTATSVRTSVTTSDGGELCAAVWAATTHIERRGTRRAPTTEEALKATEQKTAAELRAAMASPMMDAWRGEGSASIISVSSSASVATTTDDKDESKAASEWQSLAGSTKSLTELDHLAELTTGDRMDVDEPLSSIPSVPGSHPSPLLGDSTMLPPARANSCPAKRPLTLCEDDEDKRRKVDAMIVDDSATPVFSEEPAALPAIMSMSAPSVMQLAMIGGHYVKTSDTHPIVISPFIPTEILHVLGKYLIAPPESDKPLLFASDLDVPSLLLACPPPMQAVTEAGPVAAPLAPAPKTLIFTANRPVGGEPRPTRLGNLLLSSCPGKRLRMDGPVKGRGPVCRDLATDLRRIKEQGVGAIVCCLDDEELALLGVPWETYRDLAGEIGLDVLRLPMPDGFTPVSLQLFDAQVTLITTRYTLQGINVLIHCRGGIGRAGLTACAWAIKMGFVQPHPSLANVEKAAPARVSKSSRKAKSMPATPSPATEEERAIVMSIVERVIAMIRSRRGLKAIESYEQVKFLATYVTWLRESIAATP